MASSWQEWIEKSRKLTEEHWQGVTGKNDAPPLLMLEDHEGRFGVIRLPGALLNSEAGKDILAQAISGGGRHAPMRLATFLSAAWFISNETAPPEVGEAILAGRARASDFENLRREVALVTAAGSSPGEDAVMLAMVTRHGSGVPTLEWRHDWESGKGAAPSLTGRFPGALKKAVGR